MRAGHRRGRRGRVRLRTRGRCPGRRRGADGPRARRSTGPRSSIPGRERGTGGLAGGGLDQQPDGAAGASIELGRATAGGDSRTCFRAASRAARDRPLNRHASPVPAAPTDGGAFESRERSAGDRAFQGEPGCGEPRLIRYGACTKTVIRAARAGGGEGIASCAGSPAVGGPAAGVAEKDLDGLGADRASAYGSAVRASPPADGACAPTGLGLRAGTRQYSSCGQYR